MRISKLAFGALSTKIKFFLSIASRLLFFLLKIALNNNKNCLPKFMFCEPKTSYAR